MIWIVIYQHNCKTAHKLQLQSPRTHTHTHSYKQTYIIVPVSGWLLRGARALQSLPHIIVLRFTLDEEAERGEHLHLNGDMVYRSEKCLNTGEAALTLACCF